MTIRKALPKDAERIIHLLQQVHELHAAIRPDIFISGKTKYTVPEYLEIISNGNTPVFVAADDSDAVQGYVFCQIKSQPFSTNMKDFKTLYIDDLCVDENRRGEHIGHLLFDYAKQYARDNGCYDMTLNVWEGNDTARKFYENLGMFVKETQMEIIL